MATRQRIVRVRRDYNQLVADETMEDYALRFTAERARRWSPGRVASTALGSISFLALEAIGAAVTVAYGVTDAVAAILVVSALIFVVSLPICFHAARAGVDVDLLTRGAGFGYLGSTVTSLIYASFTFIFFGIEAAILAAMLHGFFGVPEWLGYVFSALVVLPLVFYGITFISRLQIWTQPVWLVLNLLPLGAVLFRHGDWLRDWTAYGGLAGASGFHLPGFGAAASILFALVTQTGEQVDYIRFLPRRTAANRGRWWLALVAGGPGWIGFDVLKLLAGSFLAFVLLRLGLPAAAAMQPAEMYRYGFLLLTGTPWLALVLTAVFVALSQIKINVTNAYAGSLAWSNFFSRLTHSHPGRVVWLVFNVAIALLLMELGLYRTIESTLVIYSNLAAAWIGALVADLVVNKPLGLSPPGIEFKRAHLYDINPVGLGAMLLAAALSLLAFAGLLGELAAALSTFIAFGTAFAAAPLIAWWTGGKYYLARKPRTAWAGRGALVCTVCENEFETPDMAYCPVYAGPICSLCCTLDSRCGDGCKPHARADRQLRHAALAVLPAPGLRALGTPLGAWLAGFAIFAACIGLVFVLIQAGAGASAAALSAALWKLLLVLVVTGGIGLWLLVLARDSRRVAEEETRRQTGLLMSEIAAHRRTDAALQKAKEAAEAASQAKSRYVVGLSHELRSPLNAILGYAQLLEREAGLEERRREGLRTIRRSGEHLLALIEGLLDISKIETGRIELYRDEVRLPEFLDGLVQMLRLQAEARGIGFRFERPERLPAVVYTDERRLRQVLLNLLANAIKFTERGEVRFSLRYRSQVAEFEVADTGPGIPPEELERVFEPFQRGSAAQAAAVPGIGLGLTITRLLTQVMGGEVTASSTPGEGSRFRVRLLLSEAVQARHPAPPEQRIAGYAGARRTVLVADDDPAHRSLMLDLLAPLGFTVIGTQDAAECRRAAAEWQPDLFLLDLAMPGMNGWALARALREEDGARAPVIIVSANTRELKQPPGTQKFHDDVLAKPVSLPVLLDKIGSNLGLEWLRFDEGAAEARPAVAALDPDAVAELRELATIGYVGGLRARLEALERDVPEAGEQVAALRALVAEYRLDAVLAALDAAPAR